MAKQSLRDKMKTAMKKRVQESYERIEDSGRFTTIFKKDLQDVNFWGCAVSKEEHILDTIPYLAGKKDPKVSEGEPTYVLDLWVHKGIGANEGSYVCPARNYNKPCPVCEDIKELKKSGDYDEDELKKLYPKRRVIYNILCYDSVKEEERGVQVWEVAHWFMERHLSPLARTPRTGGFVPFADPVEGKTIAFSRTSKTDFIGHRFLDRDYEIPDEVLEEAKCLDELIDVLSYDELYSIYHGKSISKEEITEEEVVEEEEIIEEKIEEQKKPVKRTRTRTRTRPTQKLKTDCPEGGKFGIDIESFDHCNVCEKWEVCAKKADEMEENDVPF